MARRFDLRDYPQLDRFLLRNARPTGRQFGVGSYGSVEELEIDGLLCAGKKLHDVLVEAGNDGVQNIAERFVEECTLISDLRHPDIVQFLGICSLPGSELPVLVMECLPLCLDGLLENTGDIPLAVKRSILCDVARGLTYLHNKTPPIIHRDLTAKNVLLNSAHGGQDSRSWSGSHPEPASWPDGSHHDSGESFKNMLPPPVLNIWTP